MRAYLNGFGRALTPSVKIQPRQPSGMDAVTLMGPDSHMSSRDGYMDRNNSKMIQPQPCTKACTVGVTPAVNHNSAPKSKWLK